VDTEDGFGLSAKIGLPQDFSGTVVVKEIEDHSLIDEGWLFDQSEKALDFVLGVCARVPVVPFTNNFFGREILFTKENNQGNTEILARLTPVTFTLTLSNNGSENLVNITMDDTWFALLDDDYEFDVVLSAVGSGELAEPAYQFDGETLSFDGLLLKVGEALLVSYTVVPAEVGELTNYAHVMAYGSETGLPIDGSDDSAITVRKPIYELAVTKLVAEFTEEEESLDGYEFSESVSFLSSGKKGLFEITIANNSESVLYLTGIKDIFNSEELPEDAVFYREDGSETTLVEILEEYGVLESGAKFTFYFITDALTVINTYKNEVEVTAVNDVQEEISDKDSATIVVSWSTIPPEYPPEDTPEYSPDNPVDDPIVVDIQGIAGPLAYFPATAPQDDEDFEIVDEAMPLGNLPKTGTAANAGVGLMGLFSALSAMGAAGATLHKKKEN
jgi:LPXTG-motif cell wall-anchored protein